MLLTVQRPCGETCCWDPITTKQVTDPHDALPVFDDTIMTTSTIPRRLSVRAKQDRRFIASPFTPGISLPENREREPVPGHTNYPERGPSTLHRCHSSTQR